MTHIVQLKNYGKGGNIIVFFLIDKLKLKLNKKYINHDVLLRWKEVRDAVMEAKNPETLIVGSSHGACGIQCSIIDSNGLNLCFDSIDLYLSDIMGEYFINKFNSIKRVIVTYSLFSNSYEVEKIPSTRYTLDGLDIFFGIDARRVKSKKDYSILSSIMYYKKIYIDNIKEQNIYREKNGDQKELLSPAPQASNETVANHIKHYLRNNSQNQYLEKLIKFCSDRNIEVYVIITPVREDYKLEVIKVCGKEELFKDVISICHKNSNAHLLSYFFSEKFVQEDFRDSDHLNIKGAKKLSNIIKKDIYLVS